MCELPPPRRGEVSLFFWGGKNWFALKMLIRFRNLTKKHHNLPAASKVCSGFKRLPSDATNFKNPCLTKFSELGRQTVGFFCGLLTQPPWGMVIGDVSKSRLGVKKRKLTYSKTILKHTKSIYKFPKLQPC